MIKMGYEKLENGNVYNVEYNDIVVNTWKSILIKYILTYTY